MSPSAEMVSSLKRGAEAAKFAETEILKICASWELSLWDELDWSRIKELSTRDIVERRQKDGARAQQAHASDCPNFVKHVRIESRSTRLSPLIECSFPCVTTSGSSKKISLS